VREGAGTGEGEQDVGGEQGADFWGVIRGWRLFCGHYAIVFCACRVEVEEMAMRGVKEGAISAACDFDRHVCR
jgi:hypothetical protein